MKQASLKLKMYANNTSIMKNDVENITLRFIFASFGALALLYLLLVGSMIFNIIERRNLEASARILLSEVRDLELTYLSMSSNIDLNLSYSLGFQETQATFATRKSVGSLDSRTTQNEI